MSLTRTGLPVLAALATALATALTLTPPAHAATTLSFAPSADTFVTDAAPTTVKGAGATMWANGSSPNQISYVKFDVAGIPSGDVVTAAHLTLTGAANAQPSQTVKIYNVDPAAWDENTTYSTKPALGTLVTTGTMAAGRALTVTVPVSGNGTVSYAVVGTGTASAVMATREAATGAPALSVVYDAPTVHPTSVPNASTVTIDGQDFVAQSPNKSYSMEAAGGAPPNYQRYELRSGDRWINDINQFPNDDRQRDMLRGTTRWGFNTDVWSSGSFKVTTASFKPSDTAYNIFADYHQPAEDSGDTGPRHGTLQLGIYNGTFEVRTGGDTAANTTADIPETIRYSTPWTHNDQWVNFVIHSKFSKGSATGVLEVWMNGTKIVNLANTVYGFNDTQGPYWRTGMYREGYTATVVVQVANQENGTANLADRVANPLPIPNVN